MSSISFPNNEADDQLPSSSSLNDPMNAPFYAPPPFDTSGFQMNPLSAHPPRTPRTSNASNTHHVRFDTDDLDMSASVFEDHHGHSAERSHEHETQREKPQEKAEEESEDDVDAEEDVQISEQERAKAAERRVSHHDVWREMLVTSNGRDKAFKLMQYSIRVYLLLHTKLLFRSGKGVWSSELVRRLTTARNHFSLCRKMLILFNWMSPLSQVLAAQKPVPFTSSASSIEPHIISHPFLQALLSAPPPVLLELINGLSDDLYTLSRMGLLGARFGERAGRLADWCWFFSTLAGLVENGVERAVVGGLQREVENRAYHEAFAGATAKSQPRNTRIDSRELARLQKKTYWLEVSRWKLIMDLIFVSYDLFRIRRWSDTVKSITGLSAGILSSLKVYDKHRASLVKNTQSST
ncbi:hypothetical protein CONPUDRAFT_136751 [Coniophora puteana RWD-64-598 SS2]|uniref:Peroxisomal biogenesis factor 11 n=1 Tax=Coniophora puteana (strain RWD-64-598) TaxID=741705 RepID=A0A5M3MSS7_CONPW|nr:uncharacterized protein CONPUDRAFT_136751 [Coniophora puteana RWD-64-598 SS2]EIW82219.1 hypothetical protein CONPUDRAFT_136751 [Coniophora puteana RWD-64-598 SS2]